MHASWDWLPLIIAVDRALICQADRDALAGAIVARLLPYFKQRVEVSGSVWGYSDVVRHLFLEHRVAQYSRYPRR